MVHVPSRFSGKPANWYARKTIVARRRATIAAREGRQRWAELWERAALTAAATWLDYLDAH